MSYLSYINDSDLEAIVLKVISKALAAIDKSEKKFHSNVVDPFSATFDAMTSNISLEEWIKKEKSRQAQKTLQNAVGGFHEELLGKIKGWRYVNDVVDIVSENRQIIAEIKNKHNTTKGSDKKTLYDNLLNQIEGKYNGYVGYYVEIIPKGQHSYNKPFTPSDNVTKINRPLNENIRVIDGKSFYDLASGVDNALYKLYSVLPKVISSVTGGKITDRLTPTELHNDLFYNAYSSTKTLD